MDLKSGQLYWPQLSPDLPTSETPLSQNQQTQIAIIGAGISGALCAYHLTRQGIPTTLLDRQQTAHESTAASTGLLQYEIDTPLTTLIQQIGYGKATAAYLASFDALMHFPQLAADLADPCGIIPRPSLYLASSEKDVPQLQAEFEARKSLNLDVKFLTSSQLHDQHNLIRPAALWSKHAFESDPYRLTQKLLQRSVQQGLQLHTNTEVTSIEHHASQVTLHTQAGPTLTANKVLFATGYETMNHLPKDLCQLNSTYALASDPIPDFSPWPDRALIWEAARPYLYMRTTEDNRIIVGGADDPFQSPALRDAQRPKKIRHLQKQFHKLLPQINLQHAYTWAGTFAQTPDGLPYVGTHPNHPHAYFALGYGGNGITFSLLAAQIITDLYQKKSNPLADLFKFNRWQTKN